MEKEDNIPRRDPVGNNMGFIMIVVYILAMMLRDYL